MKHIRFEQNDAILFWCIPENGCSLAYIFDVYTFVNRAAVPTYEEVSRCLSSAVRAGIMPIPPSEQYPYDLHPQWRQYFHEWDEKYSATELGIFEQSEEFAARDWPTVTNEDFNLNIEEYELAVQSHNDRFISMSTPPKGNPRELFADFLERLASGVSYAEEWSSFVVMHYPDDFLEEIRRNVVRLSIGEFKYPLDSDKGRQLLQEWAQMLRAGKGLS